MESRPSVTVKLLGQDQRWERPKECANRARDLWWDLRGGWQSSGGYRRIQRGPEDQQNPGTYINPFANAGAIESIHWFSQHDGARRWLIYIDGGGNLYAYNPSAAARGSSSPGDAAYDRAGNVLTRSVVTTPWQKNQSACWNDNFYLINGIDRPLVFNGYWWDFAGFVSPAGAPSAVTMVHPRTGDDGPGSGGSLYTVKQPNSGIGPDSEVNDTDYIFAYRYRMSFVNSRGQESPLSDPSPLVTGTNFGGTDTVSTETAIASVSLPTGGSEVVARRLYRTVNINDTSNNAVSGRGEVYYLLAEIPDNFSSVYEDTKTDGFLASQAVAPLDRGTFPIGARFLAPFKNCMFVSGVGNSTVQYSLPGYPEVFPFNNVIDVGDAHLGPITAMYATRNALVVFKASAVYLVKGDPVNGFFAETLTRGVGCIAQNSVRDVPDVGLGFLGQDAYYALQGTLENEGTPTNIVNLTTPLSAWMRRMNRSAAIGACAAVYHRDKELWLCIPTLGWSNPNIVLVYHYEIREWTWRENFPVGSILETPDEQGLLLFGSYAATSGVSPDGVAHLGIMVYSRGWADKDGTAIEPLYETGQFSASGVYRTIRPKYVMVDAIGHGNNNLTINVTTNRSLTTWYSTAPSHQQQYPQEPLPVYGTATFDTVGVTWQSWRPITQRFDIENVRAGPANCATVILQPAAGTRFMTLCNLDMEMSPDDPTPTKPLRGSS